MKIGSNCFSDKTFKSIVDSLHNVGTCEITKSENQNVYDSNTNEELLPYLEQILDLFTPVSSMKHIQGVEKYSASLYDILEKWNMFSVKSYDIEIILKAIFHSKLDENAQIFTENVIISEFLNEKYMNQSAILKKYSWKEFCEDIKYHNRFHSSEVNVEQLTELLKFLKLEIPSGKLSLFRARICDAAHYDIGYKDDKDIGAPPKNVATAGRINSEGIPCLYLADSDITTFHEVRARVYDHITLGVFENIVPLNIIDLCYLDSITPFQYEDVDLTWFAINIEAIKQIAKEISKPMRRFDKDIDYVPTQYIADYIKNLGYDGIKYKSTINEGGINYAIFDPEKFKCVSKQHRNIKNINFKAENFL